MKINPYLQSSFYKSRPAAPAAGGPVPAASQGEQAHKMDTITISQDTNRLGAYSGLARKIAGEVVSACDSPARVSELRQAVAAGAYHVPTEDLAGAILSHVVAE